MADELFEVPLFPLNVVLFPGMALPLHIFEQRYREMTADCLADRAPFGVVLALTDEDERQVTPARVGTLARIADYEQLPGGRYNMLALGTSRFEIVDYKTHKSYLIGIVRPLRDRIVAADDLDMLAARARAALDDYLHVMLALVGSEDQHLDIPGEAAELSYLIGMCLTCGDAEKQELLETTSLPQRLRTGIALLRAEVKQLSRQLEHVEHVEHVVDNAQGVLLAHDADRSLLN